MNKLSAGDDNSAHEQEPAGMKRGISINGLHKKFKVEPMVLLCIYDSQYLRPLVVQKLLWTICI